MKQERKKDSNKTRINQFISHNSRYSRREADELIKNKRITINNKIAELGDFVGVKDLVFLDKKIQIRPNKSYTIIAYNKPKGELCAKSDSKDRRVIFDSLPREFSGFKLIGRLDFASAGLLLLSDSAEIVNALMNSNLEREYNLKLDGKIPQNAFLAMENGIFLKDARAGGHSKSTIKEMNFAPFAGYCVSKNGNEFSKIKVQICEGQNRELRRFFAHFGRNILDLKRTKYGFISLNALPEGKWRYLEKSEYEKVRQFLEQTKQKR